MSAVTLTNKIWRAQPAGELERTLVAIGTPPPQRSSSQCANIEACWSFQQANFEKWQEQAEIYRTKSPYKNTRRSLVNSGTAKLNEDSFIVVIPSTFETQVKGLFQSLPFQAKLLPFMPFPQALQMHSKLIQISIVGRILLSDLPEGIERKKAFYLHDVPTYSLEKLEFVRETLNLKREYFVEKYLKDNLKIDIFDYDNSFLRGFRLALKIIDFSRERFLQDEGQSFCYSLCIGSGQLTLTSQNFVCLLEYTRRQFNHLFETSLSDNHDVKVARIMQAVALNGEDRGKILISECKFLFKLSDFRRYESVDLFILDMFKPAFPLNEKVSWAKKIFVEFFEKNFSADALEFNDVSLYKIISHRSDNFSLLLSYTLRNEQGVAVALCQAKVTAENMHKQNEPATLSVVLIHDIIFSPFVTEAILKRVLTINHE